MDNSVCLVVGIYMISYLTLRTWQDSMGIWRAPITLLVFACMVAPMCAYGLPVMGGLLSVLLVDFAVLMYRFAKETK